MEGVSFLVIAGGALLVFCLAMSFRAWNILSCGR